MPAPPATYSASAIGDVLQKVVDEVRKAYEADRRSPDRPPILLNAVDLELNFKNVIVNESGWVIFGKDTSQSQIEIRLATRITPDAARNAG